MSSGQYDTDYSRSDSYETDYSYSDSYETDYTYSDSYETDCSYSDYEYSLHAVILLHLDNNKGILTATTLTGTDFNFNTTTIRWSLN